MTFRSATPVFVVRDIAATIQWYRTHLRFEGRGVPANPPHRFGIMTRDEVQIFLQQIDGYEKPDLYSAREGGVWHAYLQVESVRGLFEVVSKDAGVTLMYRLRRQEYGQIEFAIKDLNGYVLVFAEAVDERTMTETNPPPPTVECEQQHPIFAVADLAAAVRFYTTKLGFMQAFLWGDPPTMAGVNLGREQIFLQQGAPSPKGLSVYFVVGDADNLHAFHRANGVDIVGEPGDRPYGLRDYSVKDLDGYVLTFGQRCTIDEGPPLKIERVDVPVRLEKRLAALLQDLAAYKRMTLTNCLEEILLHTCEPFGDGVASPHTSRDLRHIQQLKKKHGIDYDSHASYRFVEE